LQSLVKAWIIEVLRQIQYAVKQGCEAAQCIE